MTWKKLNFQKQFGSQCCLIRKQVFFLGFAFIILQMWDRGWYMHPRFYPVHIYEKVKTEILREKNSIWKSSRMEIRCPEFECWLDSWNGTGQHFILPVFIVYKMLLLEKLVSGAWSLFRIAYFKERMCCDEHWVLICK